MNSCPLQGGNNYQKKKITLKSNKAFFSHNHGHSGSPHHVPHNLSSYLEHNNSLPFINLLYTSIPMNMIFQDQNEHLVFAQKKKKMNTLSNKKDQNEQHVSQSPSRIVWGHCPRQRIVWFFRSPYLIVLPPLFLSVVCVFVSFLCARLLCCTSENLLRSLFRNENCVMHVQKKWRKSIFQHTIIIHFSSNIVTGKNQYIFLRKNQYITTAKGGKCS